MAAKLRATANKNVNANSVLHMARPPCWRERNLIFIFDFFWIRHPHRGRHNRVDIREPEVDCYHFGGRRRAGMRTGSKAERGEGDQA